jgi:hypothetical protein
MAETLSEIFNGTLTASDFTNGEATILTTNATTAHVIKDVKVLQGSTSVPIDATLKVGNFPLANLSSDISGSEIIAPNSTLKVSSSSFPLPYIDTVIQFQESTNTLKNKVFPTINGFEAAPSENTSEDITYIPHRTNDQRARQIFTGIGPSNFSMGIFHDNNSVTQFYLYNSSGTTIFSDTGTYMPKWFDGYRYVYWTSGTNALTRFDAWEATSSTISLSSSIDMNTNARMFGLADEYIIFWQTGGSPVSYYLDLKTLKLGQLLANTTPYTAFQADDKRFYLSKFSDGLYRILKNANQNTLVSYVWLQDSLLSGAQSGTIITLPVPIAQESEAQVVIGNTFYYSNTSRNLQAFNLETLEISNLGSLGTTQVYGHDIWAKTVIPDALTISNRSYTLNPSLSLRVTGVTSTQG